MESLHKINSRIFRHRHQNIANKRDEAVYFFETIKNETYKTIKEPGFKGIADNTFYWNSFFKNVFRLNDISSWRYLLHHKRNMETIIDASRIVKHLIIREPILIPLFSVEPCKEKGILLQFQSKTLVVLDIENNIAWKIAKKPTNNTELIGELESREVLLNTNVEDIAPPIIEKDLGNPIQSIGIELLQDAKPVSKYRWKSLFLHFIAPVLFEFYQSAGINVVKGTEYIEFLKNKCVNHKDYPEILKFINFIQSITPAIDDINVYLTHYHGEILPHHVYKSRNSIKIIDWGRQTRGNLLYDLARQEFSWPNKHIWHTIPFYQNLKTDRLSLGMIIPYIDMIENELNISIDNAPHIIMFNYLGCLIEYWNNLPEGITGPARHKLVTIINLLRTDQIAK